MDLDDLKKFLVVAQTNNLQSASSQLHATPGALSKIIKRIERELDTELFERTGRNITLNQQGEKFRQYAVSLVHEAEQIVSEFTGSKHTTTVKVSGPSLLLHHYLPNLLNQFSHAEFEYNVDACWEGQAVNKMATGQSHFAITTSLALSENKYDGDFERVALGTTNYQVVASESHPVFTMYPNRKITSEQLYLYGFAVPNVSPFCGIKRGVGSDSWRDDKARRRITHRCNDFSVLMSLVNHGIALAYVPDFVAKSHNLIAIDVVDYAYLNQEKIELVYKKSLASGWLAQISTYCKNIG